MTVFESIKSKNIDELAEWLFDYCDFAIDTPWINWFDKNYCKKCDGIFYEDSEYGWCELNGKCRFFQDMDNIPDDKKTIKLWLKSEVEC